MHKFAVIILSLILAFPLNVSAEESSGLQNGTKENPFVITTVSDLKDISNNLNAHYILGNDIIFSKEDTFLPIGTKDKPFLGSLNGNGKKISGLCMSFNGTAFDDYTEEVKEEVTVTPGSGDGYTGDYEIDKLPSIEQEKINKIPKNIGLFGVNNGEIYDLHLENINIEVNSKNEVNVGIFIGLNNGQIYRCYSTVSSLSVLSNIDDACGGLVGENGALATIGNCFSKSKVSSTYNAGGIAGKNYGYLNCCFYYDYKVEAKNSDAICQNYGVSQNNYYLQGLLQSSNGTAYTTKKFSYDSYFKEYNFNSIWQINSVLKHPELKTNKYPIKQQANSVNLEIESTLGSTVSFKTDGNILFSLDNKNFTYNNVFKLNYDTPTKIYAKMGETLTNYVGTTTQTIDITLSKSYDISEDGFVDLQDLVLLRKYIALWSVSLNKSRTDINNDGKVCAKDILYLSKHLAMWENYN